MEAFFVYLCCNISKPIMSVTSFIGKVNQLALAGTPFFFIIDFEKKKPLVYSFEEAAKENILFDIRGLCNYSKPKLNSFAHQIMPKQCSEDRYKTAFDMVQEHLNRGDSYLVNLTFPTEVSFDGNLKDLFHNAQSQYKVLFKDQFVSYSPECFVKIKGNTIYSYPMKGTISTAIPNAEQHVLGNPKEIAEHATIVDLIRNDLSFYASEVRVNRFRYLEQINVNPESLLQVSSEIEGTLKNDWKVNLGNLLWDMLPAGSISGAPKPKTLEIIRSVEADSRGYYTGVYGYFDGQNLDSAVAIRFLEKQENKFFYRSGGGVTSQSNCSEEHQELLDKIYVPTF